MSTVTLFRNIILQLMDHMITKGIEKMDHSINMQEELFKTIRTIMAGNMPSSQVQMV
ncbi:MAG: hypothetical protein Q8L07_11435 [Sediminibacterium sp.]|nr:hypothetical protein [Sediminibacterium sp.]